MPEGRHPAVRRDHTDPAAKPAGISAGLPGILGISGSILQGGAGSNLFTHDISAFTDMDGHMNDAAARAFSTVLAEQLERADPAQGS